MIKEAIQHIEKNAKPDALEINGRPYSTGLIHGVFEPLVPIADTHTLRSILGYRLTEEEKGRACIRIEDAKNVFLESFAFGPFRQKDTFVHATTFAGRFAFNQWMSLENFIIAIMTNFVQTEATQKLLKVTGNISDATVKTLADDGVTQAVTVKAGVSMKSEETLKAQIMMRPFYTFPEIKQPEVPCVFRVKSSGDNVSAALFTADNELWQLRAIESIETWFLSQGTELPIIA